MKKITKLSILAALMLVMGMFLVSCGQPPALEGDEAVGTWTMNGAEYSGMTLTAEDLKSAMDEMPVLTINEDGTCLFTFNGQDGAGVVSKSEDGSKYALTDKSENTLEFTIDDGVLKLDYEAMNMVMIFEK